MHKLIKMLSVIGLDVNRTATGKQDRQTDTAKTRGNRTDKGNAIHTGDNRCIAKQKAYRTRTLYGLQCVLRKCRKKDATGESHKGTCIKKRQTNRATKVISIPPFLFSYQFTILLQSIDDVCLHINPILWSMML